MNWRYLTCIAVVLLANWTLESATVAETNETHAAAALFQDSETVFRTASNLLSDSANGGGEAFVTEPFNYLTAGLGAIQGRARADITENSEAVLLGAKDFQPPLGLGRVRSTWCYIVVLRSGNSLDLSKYFEKVEAAQAAAGAPVWHWSAKLQEFGEDDPRLSSLFAAEIGQSYVLVSNNLQELLIISRHLASADGDESVLAEIRDWNDVKQHELWGYRKYRADSLAGFSRIIGTAGVTSAAKALIVFVDLKKHMCVLRLRSSRGEDPTPKNISATYSIPPLKSIGPGLWEAAFPLSEAGQLGTANSVLWLFGWGVVV
jgi:hypothetical protein